MGRLRSRQDSPFVNASKLRQAASFAVQQFRQRDYVSAPATSFGVNCKRRFPYSLLCPVGPRPCDQIDHRRPACDEVIGRTRAVVTHGKGHSTCSCAETTPTTEGEFSPSHQPNTGPPESPGVASPLSVSSSRRVAVIIDVVKADPILPGRLVAPRRRDRGSPRASRSYRHSSDCREVLLSNQLRLSPSGSISRSTVKSHAGVLGFGFGSLVVRGTRAADVRGRTCQFPGWRPAVVVKPVRTAFSRDWALHGTTQCVTPSAPRYGPPVRRLPVQDQLMLEGSFQAKILPMHAIATDSPRERTKLTAAVEDIPAALPALPLTRPHDRANQRTRSHFGMINHVGPVGTCGGTVKSRVGEAALTSSGFRRTNSVSGSPRITRAPRRRCVISPALRFRRRPRFSPE